MDWVYVGSKTDFAWNLAVTRKQTADVVSVGLAAECSLSKLVAQTNAAWGPSRWRLRCRRREHAMQALRMALHYLHCDGLAQSKSGEVAPLEATTKASGA